MPVERKVIEIFIRSENGDWSTTITDEKVFHDWRGDYYSNTDLVGEMETLKEFISHLQGVVNEMSKLLLLRNDCAIERLKEQKQ